MKLKFFIPLAVLISSPVLAQEADQAHLEEEAQAYTDCMNQAGNDPESALDMALTWRDTGGGLPARHCVAYSYIGLGQYINAALEFEAMADEMRRGLGWSFPGVSHPGKRGMLAEVYAQGGNAWLLSNDPVKAVDLFTLGLEAAEDRTEIRANLLIDRAIALGEIRDYGGALEDITAVQALVAPSADLYVLKASALRGLERFPEAMVELENAFRLEPENREAYLERGNLLRSMGDTNGARQNWIAYLRLYPDGPAADQVRQNLENLDVNPDGN